MSGEALEATLWIWWWSLPHGQQVMGEVVRIRGCMPFEAKAYLKVVYGSWYVCVCLSYIASSHDVGVINIPVAVGVLHQAASRSWWQPKKIVTWRRLGLRYSGTCSFSMLWLQPPVHPHSHGMTPCSWGTFLTKTRSSQQTSGENAECPMGRVSPLGANTVRDVWQVTDQ